jgi:ankyrin repeat protein
MSVNNLFTTYYKGRTPLFYSLFLEKNDLLYKLILAGANINQQDKIGWTTLHHAVQRYNLPATYLLLKSGVDLEMKDDYGNTPLLRAVFESNGKGDIIKLLLNSGADIYNKNDFGISTIELAEAIASYNVIQFFRN